VIQGKIAKYAFSKVLEHLFSKSKRFKKVLDYVHKENDADKRINELETDNAITKAKLEQAILEIKSLKDLLKKAK
tara:strand:+ start:2809 stop:3033 length:225 start_codon:yes stop_codon:yes gene_type:complete